MHGVDFGTSTSLVGESTTFAPRIIPLGSIDPWLPSVFGRDGTDSFAGERADLLPEQQTVRSIKRAISRGQHVVTINDGVQDVELQADDVIRSVLSMIRISAAEQGLDLSDEGAVRLGCPAMWTGPQRHRLLRLAQDAGLPVGDSTLIDEPIAAGVAWVNEMVRSNRSVVGKVLVFDMGGGTLDVAVLDVEARPGFQPAISVQSAVGRDEAGDGLDEAITRDLIIKYRDAGFDLPPGLEGVRLSRVILQKARQAKIELSDLFETSIVIEALYGDLPPLEYSRAELDLALAPQLARAMSVVEHAMRAAVVSQVHSATNAETKRPSAIRRLELSAQLEQLDYVLLVGGMAKVPAVRSHLEKFVQRDRIYIGGAGEPGLAIVQGLAEDAAYERLNLHRPGFDFVLEWVDEGGKVQVITVYPAYTPLYSSEQVFSTDSTKYSWRPADAEVVLPRRGTATLRARSVSGTNIDFKVKSTAGVEREVTFQFGAYGHNAVIQFEPNGEIFVRDAAQYQGRMRIKQWPSIRGRGHEAVTAEELPRREEPARPVSRDRNKEG